MYIFLALKMFKSGDSKDFLLENLSKYSEQLYGTFLTI